MAIEFAQCVVYSRSRGKSAVQAAAYRSASILFDERIGQRYDFTQKEHVAHSEILLPAGADETFSNREFLWNEVERAEIRCDAQVAKDYILALPNELTLEQNIVLARQFAHDHFVSKGIPVDLNIHVEKGNVHAHLLTPTRRLVGKQFSLKARDLNPGFYRGIVSEKDYWGKTWRRAQDTFFKSNNINLEVDPNHLIATRHRGRKKGDVRAEYLDGINQIHHEMEREIALQDPESLLNILSEKHAVFSERELACVIHKATDTSAEYEAAMCRVKAHADLITLGPGDDGRVRYTSRQSVNVEWNMQAEASSLAAHSDHAVAAWRLDEQFKKYGLNQGQQDALRHMLTGEDIALVVGKAGTGKSYMMNAAREVWEAESYRVLGISVAGVAAEGLESGSKIKSSTIAAFKLRIEKGYLKLGDKDVIVLDEAGMVDNRDLAKIVSVTKTAGAKLVLVGDPSQLQSIGPGAPFRALLDKIGFVALTEIQRQRLAEDKIATTLLSSGKTAGGIDIYANKGQIFLSETEQDSLNLLLSKWTQHITSGGLMSETIILAHRNDDVKMINQKIRESLINQAYLTGEHHQVKTSNGNLDLMIGDRILFLENNSQLNVKNGHFATVTEISGSTISAEIGSGKSARIVSFNTAQYQNFTYGYAATVHKTQGVTVDNTFVFAGGKYWSRNLTYVALSRHRDNAYLFADKETHTDFDTLKKNMGRLSIKDAVIDFPLNYAIRRGLDAEKVLDQCLMKLNQVKDKIKDKWLFVSNVEAFNEKLEQTQQEAAKQQRRQDAVKVAEYVDLNRAIGRAFADMKQSLSAGKEISEHESYPAAYHSMTDRNRLAHEIYCNAPKYELAMELNGVDIADLQKHSKSHEARERVIHYEIAGGRLAAGKAAQPIVSDGRAHGLYVCERGLDWSEINGLAKEYTQREANHKHTPAERQAYQDLIRYRAANQQSAHAWERVYTEQGLQKVEQKQPYKIYQANNEKKINIAKAFSQQRDELAFKIQENIIAYEPFCDELKINRQRLEKSVLHYRAVQAKQPKEMQLFQTEGEIVRLSPPILDQINQYMIARINYITLFGEEKKAAEQLRVSLAKDLVKIEPLWAEVKKNSIEERAPIDTPEENEQRQNNTLTAQNLRNIYTNMVKEIHHQEWLAKEPEREAEKQAQEALERSQPVQYKLEGNHFIFPKFFHEKLMQYVETQEALSKSIRNLPHDTYEKERLFDIASANRLSISEELMKEAHLWGHVKELSKHLYPSPPYKIVEAQIRENRIEPLSLETVFREIKEEVSESKVMTKAREKYLPETKNETVAPEQAASFSVQDERFILSPSLQEKIDAYLAGIKEVNLREDVMHAVPQGHWSKAFDTFKSVKEKQLVLAKEVLKESELWEAAEKITKRVIVADHLKPEVLQAQMKRESGVDAKVIQQLRQDVGGHQYREHRDIHQSLEWSHSLGRSHGRSY